MLEFAKVVDQLKPSAQLIDEDTARIFKRYDFDRSGHLSNSELRSALRDMGVDVASPEAVATIAKYDKDRNGSLTVEEFAQVCKRLRPQPPPPREVASVRKVEDDIRDTQERIFKKYDRNRDGTLDKRELRNALSELNLDVSSDEATAALRKFDADGSGSLGMSEFMRLASMLAPIASDDVIKAFKKYDANGTGALDRQELEAALKEMGLNMSSKEVGAAMKSVDADNNGRLDLTEFARLLKILEPVLQVNQGNRSSSRRSY